MAEMRLEGGPKVIYPSRWIADVRLVRGMGCHNAVIRNAFRLYACIMKSRTFFFFFLILRIDDNCRVTRMDYLNEECL